MKGLGKTIFEVVISLILWAVLLVGVFVITIFSPSVAHFVWFGLAILLSWTAYWGVKKSIQSKKQLVCPNGCDIVQVTPPP